MWAPAGFPHSGLRPPALLFNTSPLVGPLALYRRGLGLAFRFVMWASVGSPHSGLRPPAFFLNTPHLGWALGSVPKGALGSCLVASCGPPLGLLTAAFGRRLSFSILPHWLGPWLCTEGGLGLAFRFVMWASWCRKGLWTCVWFRHVGVRWVSSQRPSAAGFLFLIPQVIGPLVLYRRGLGLVFGFVMWTSVGSPHSGLRPPAFFLNTSPMGWALGIVPKEAWTCV